ncbi:myrosinase 1-like [Epargyreus clarus]|uniref:myrosinase 1-like n=1 Tax=Epargyreus clarus TaxID=520877 RepID=UPI003C2F8395
MYLTTVLLSGLLCVTSAMDRKFPPNFLFGAATSAYQVEGAWNVSGKGESIWDRLVHEHPEAILGQHTGNIAADSYNKWDRDVAACADMGLHFYRFSISWTRILPTGLINNISKDGVEYYNNLINGLLENNIEAMVTLHHFDMPQKLQDLGGWTNPHVVEWFASYSELVYSLYADRVKFWITINEPASVCDISYSGVLAPGIQELTLAPYLCNKHVLLAHAKSWRIYDKHFKPKYHGRVSIANHLLWLEPAYENMTAVTELAREFMAGRYSHPIYSEEGGWPPQVEEHMAILSKKQGFKSSRLPSFTDKEKQLIKGTYDYYAINHYTSRLVREPYKNEDLGVWFLSGSPELNIILQSDPKWTLGSSAILPLYPPGIRKQLAWLKEKYGDIDFIITENGYSSAGSHLNDYRRVKFIHDYLEQILLSIKIDKVKVTGYTYWSLLDNFEWADGYHTHFGLYEIDFEDPDRPRIPRLSSEYYASVVKTHTLIDPEMHSAQIHGTGRYKRKKPDAQNGGCNAAQNGRLALALVFISTMLCL